MKTILKVKSLFQGTAAVLFAITLSMSCQSGEPSSEEPNVDNAAVVEPSPVDPGLVDSTPPLSTDTSSSTRPETIKNPTRGQQ